MRHPSTSSLRLGLVPLLAAAVLAACAGKEPPQPLPSQTTTQVTPQLEPPPPDLPPPVRQLPVSKPTTVKVIDPGGESGPETLVEASNLARQRKKTMPPPVAEINDENLAQHAEGGQLIILSESPAVPPPAPAPADKAADRAATNGDAAAAGEADPAASGPAADPTAEATGGDARGESYWRNRALELRMSWRRAIDEISGLELETAALRQQFYAEEDLHVRDNQIKPSWDRALDRLERLRERSAQLEAELDRLVADGRRSEVPQGWLNEGWELEPTPEERDRLGRVGRVEAVETPIADPAKDID